MDALVTVDEKREPVRVAGASQLRSTLDEAANHARARGLLNVAYVTVPAGHIMGIVLGGDDSALTFTYDHRKPPYLASRGTATVVDPVLTCYISYTHHTELPRYSVIPLSLAMETVQDFAASGTLPSTVQWAET